MSLSVLHTFSSKSFIVSGLTFRSLIHSVYLCVWCWEVFLHSFTCSCPVFPALFIEKAEWMLLNCGVGKYSWESLGLQGDKPVNSKGNQPWIFIGRTDAEAPILWPSDGKNWLIRKDPDAGKDWRQEEKGMTEDEMVGWHHWLSGLQFE